MTSLKCNDCKSSVLVPLLDKQDRAPMTITLPIKGTSKLNLALLIKVSGKKNAIYTHNAISIYRATAFDIKKTAAIGCGRRR